MVSSRRSSHAETLHPSFALLHSYGSDNVLFFGPTSDRVLATVIIKIHQDSINSCIPSLTNLTEYK